MESIFLSVLNMSITAGWIVLAVALLRLFLRKAPKWITCLLWTLVAIRLVCPFSFESILSLIPRTEPVSPEIVYSGISSDTETIADMGNTIIYNTGAPETASSMGNVQIALLIASLLWILGIAGMLTYALVSYLKIRHKTKASLCINDNIFICDNINTPFILGFFRPRIYLPSALSKEDSEYVIAHEKAHIRRKDHLWKPLGFLLLSVYWFNPLIWLAYILLCRDIELACDEKVIKEMGTDWKKEYSSALLACSVPRKMISACPLAFGEVSVKQRIRSVLNYNKPTFWISFISLVLCIAMAVCFLTNPVSNNPHGVKVITDGSDIKGVSIELEELKLEESENSYIEIKWNNETQDSFTLGEEFYIYKNTDGHWRNCRVGDNIFVSIGYLLDAEGSFTHKYGLGNVEFDGAGRYKFESTFLKDGDSTLTKYKAWIEFEVKEVPDTAASSSTMEGVTAEIVSFDPHGKASSCIEVKWHNDTNKELVAGEDINIYRYTKGGWESCRNDDYSFSDIAYLISPKSSHIQKYSLENFKISTSGKYRFVTHFFTEEDSNTSYRLWVDFELDKMLNQVVSDNQIETINSSSRPQGISAQVTFVNQNTDTKGKYLDENSKLTIAWHNQTGKTLTTYIENFNIKKYAEGKYQNHRAFDMFYYSTTAVNIPADATVEIPYSLYGVNELDNGIYMLSTTFYSETNFEYTAQVEFGIGTTNATSVSANDEALEYTEYYCNDSEDVIKPQLRLSTTGNRFQFTLSGLSSYVPTGSYIVTDDTIVLSTDDGFMSYVFNIIDKNTLEFVESKSSTIPSFKYSSGEPARQPFTNGARFERKTAESVTDNNNSSINNFNEIYKDTLKYPIDTIEYDIDNDGITEVVTLGAGPTSGTASFAIIASENGNIEYANWYQGPYHKLSFKTDKNGTLYIRGNQFHKFDLDISGNRLVISENGKEYGAIEICDEVETVVKKYINGYKTHNVSKLNSCFKNEFIDTENKEAVETLINTVEDCSLKDISFDEVTDAKILATVTYEIIYSEDYIPVGTRDIGYNLITCQITFENTNGNFLIAEMGTEQIKHDR